MRAVDEWWTRSVKDLVEMRRNMSAGTPDGIALDRVLELRIAEQQDEASGKLVLSTDKLVASTQRLGTATWWLVAGTLLLGLSAAVDVVLKLVGHR